MNFHVPLWSVNRSSLETNCRDTGIEYRLIRPCGYLFTPNKYPPAATVITQHLTSVKPRIDFLLLPGALKSPGSNLYLIHKHTTEKAAVYERKSMWAFV